MIQATAQTGFIHSAAGELFYELRGESALEALVCAHGGPGFTSHYLEALFDLSDERPVICYDQAGCGRSRQRGAERKDFTVDGFVEELEALRAHHQLDRMYLFGHSFGGVIVGEYALRYPQRVAGIIFACVSIDIPRWIEDGQRLIAGMPLLQRMVLREGLRQRACDSPQFQAALAAYYTKHVYGFEVKPQCVELAEAQADARTYRVVWGENELCVNGLVKDYNLAPRLPSLQSPTLFMCGRHDEATPEAHQSFAALVPGSTCHIFERSAHHPQITEREEFLQLVRSFLRGTLCASS